MFVSTPISSPERWATVPGFERYEVSTLGAVRHKAAGVARKGFKRDTGYIAHFLRSDGRQKCFLAHSLVLEAFGGPRPEGQVCRHLNGDPSDNRLENLAWGTHEMNGADARRHGRTPAGEKNHQAKLTAADVLAIRASKEPSTVIARRLGVGPRTVAMARKGKTWAAL